MSAGARGERLSVHAYTVADGLPHDMVRRVASDAHGYLWFCTREGLAQFDGERFTTFERFPDLRQRNVRDIVAIGDTYWIATSDALVRFVASSSASRQDEIQRVLLPSGANAVLAGTGNDLWIGTDEGLFLLDTRSSFPSSLRRIDAIADAVFCLARMADGSIWAGGLSGLRRLIRRGANIVATGEGSSSDDVRSVLQDRFGSIWAGTTYGLRHLTLHDGRYEMCRFDHGDGLPGDVVQALLETADGHLYIGTTDGLFETALPAPGGPIALRKFGVRNGLPDQAILSLAEDRHGDIWLGTESGGAIKISRNAFTTYTEEDGLVSGRIRSILEDRTGKLCVISSNDVLHWYEGEHFRSERLRFPRSLDYFGWGWDQIAFQDPDGDWWLATGRGLYRFPNVPGERLAATEPRTVYDAKAGLPSENVFRIFRARDGNVWVSVFDRQRPIVRIDPRNDHLDIYGIADGVPPDDAPTAFAEDAAGNLWIGLYNGGVMRYRGGRFTPVAAFRGGSIRDLYLDHGGRLWIAATSGAARIDDPTNDEPRVRFLSAKDGVSSNHVLSIAEDRFGRIYLGTGRGITRLDPATGNVRQFTTADGLPNSLINVAFTDRRGAVWFGTLHGLARLDPEVETRRVPPPVRIVSVRVDGAPKPMPLLGSGTVPPFELAAGAHRVDVDFASVRLGERLEYEYRIGNDGQWSLPTAQRSISLANLTAGNYRFEVRSINSEGGASPSRAVVSFSVLPPLWRRWWFATAALLLVGVLIHSLYRARARRLIEMERVRTRIASDLHDDIGANLSRVAILAEVVKKRLGESDEQSQRLLGDVADSARNAVDSMSDVVWSVDPRRDAVDHLVSHVREYAEAVLTPAGICWTFDVQPQAADVKLAPDQRRHIYLIFKEAIHNIVRHSGCRNAALSLRIQRHTVDVDIRDDGRGFAEPDSNGHGLTNMKQRAAELHGTFEVMSTPGAGTRLQACIPLRRTA